jgi:hypothetical protein
MPKVKVQYTKRYYKTIDTEVEVPDHVAPDEIQDWLYANETDLFEEIIYRKSLNLEESEVEILDNPFTNTEDDQVRAFNRNNVIEQIQIIIDNHGEFSIADVEADHSPYLSGDGRFVHLMEDFDKDGGMVYVYDPQSKSSDEIDTYPASYEDLEDDQLEYVLGLGQKWSQIKDEEEV